MLMDPGFPFAKYIESEYTVPATRILYSLGDANIRIRSDLWSKEAVQGWWNKCGGNLEGAASTLPLEQFSTAELQGGQFIAMPPQLLWYLESDFPTSTTSSTAHRTSKFIEVRYISIMPNRELDFNYWSDGTYDEISCYNRDLLAPAVTGWGTEPTKREKRFRGAIEMRGVWAIGDALLGLMSWRSPLIQLELCQLFDAPPGNWFNSKFVNKIQTWFDEKLESMVETLQLVHKCVFS
ncbi:hypothetical protein L873DRAFT_1795134 [Choiromyces venosus 120613-1]|uniref:Uncharacterized protein n=1 Tax=Choiromyces venosus 120613-1 TaxID=1336337 RepID=A0A3N4JB70_9PEZI|nr:hypothetical protein L873DRAFT_1795134 [Choiromyces venosus 120613-1]